MERADMSIRNLIVLASLAISFVLLQGCGPREPVLDARLGLMNGPTSYNDTRVIYSGMLDNKDDVIGDYGISEDLRRQVLSVFPDGLMVHVVANTSWSVVFVKYDEIPRDRKTLVIYKKLSKYLYDIDTPLGIYNNEYVPYSMDLWIRPDFDRMIIVLTCPREGDEIENKPRE